MDKKDAIIVILIITLGVTIYFVFQKTKLNIIENETVTSSAFNAIIPSQALKTSFDASPRHFGAELSCFPSSRFDCNLDGCVPSAPSTYYFVDYGKESGTYFRCDDKGCDDYKVGVYTSGIYTQFIPSQGQAVLFKVVNDDVLDNKGEFVDVSTIGTTTILSFGKCETSQGT